MTERTRRLLAEHERETHFREALLSALQIAVFYEDAAGRYLGCNEAFSRALGVTAEELRRRTLPEVWPDRSYSDNHERDLRLLESGGVESYEGRLVDATGRWTAVWT